MHNVKQLKTVLFDMDGTLVDQFETIVRAFNHMEAELNLPLSDFDKLKATIGAPLPSVVEQLAGPELKDEGVRILCEHFEEIMLDDVRILPGALWLLDALKKRGLTTVIFTNNRGDCARAIAEHLNIHVHLHHIVGSGDTPHMKPDKEYTEYVLNLTNSCPETAILIGDSPFDIDAGACLGMPVYSVATGSHSREELLAHTNQPTAIYSDLFELAESVFGLVNEDALLTA